MGLYSGTSAQFIQDSTRNQIADKLKESFFEYFRYNPSPNEMNSWLFPPFSARPSFWTMGSFWNTSFRSAPNAWIA